MIGTCKYCKEEYFMKRTDAKYCSNTCRQKAYLKRKRKANKRFFTDAEKLAREIEEELNKLDFD